MKLTPADRREVIEDILDINIFSVMNAVIKNRITDNKTQISDTKNKLELSQHKYDLEKKYIESLQQDNEGNIEKCRREIQVYNYPRKD
jgi:DNA repair exonuclease SbcCD ATPase subunit